MRTRWMAWIVGALLGFGVASVPDALAGRAKDKVEQAAAQEVVVHLSKGTNDLHAVMMGLKLGTGMAGKGARVTLFLDLEGVRVADRRTEDALTWGEGHATLGELYATFVEAGGGVLVCPHCAKAAGIGPGDLRPGARVGTFDEITALMLSADKILDY